VGAPAEDPDRPASLRVGEGRDRDADGVEHLAGLDVRGLVRAVGPPEHRGHHVTRDRDHDRGQLAQDVHVVGVQADLLVGLAQRGGDGVLARLEPPAGQGDLPGVVAQLPGALDEEEVGLRAALRRREQQQDGRGAEVAGRRGVVGVHAGQGRTARGSAPGELEQRGAAHRPGVLPVVHIPSSPAVRLRVRRLTHSTTRRRREGSASGDASDPAGHAAPVPRGCGWALAQC
jgi:hypothetical protein